jgi:hypothetical protein
VPTTKLSRGAMLNSELNTSARAIIARCEITAPFGRPVVPLV